MIVRICGRLERVGEGEVTVAVGGLSYQILVSEPACRNLRSRLGGQVVLHTLYYLQGYGMNQLQPILLGFEHERERAFFQLLTTVDGLGPKAALRLLTEPVEHIAAAIERGDVAFLRRLPGIGKQKAGEIIAKLRGKAAAFVGEADTGAPSSPLDETTAEEVLGVLAQLGYSRREAERMLREAWQRVQADDAETLIREIFARVGRGASS